MNVAFDGSILTAGPPTGVARAFVTTLTAYRSLYGGRIDVLVPRRDPQYSKSLEPAAPAWHPLSDLVPAGCEIVGVAPGYRARQTSWPEVLRGRGAALLHAPVAAIPLRAGIPTVATLHDLPWLDPRTQSELAARWRFRLAARWALDRANAVVVPSAATAAAIERWRPRHRAAVRVIAHGHATGSPKPIATEDRHGPFVALGDDRPRKNRARTAEAHRRALARCPDLPAIEWIGPPDHWLSEDDKHARLASARGLLHFSLLEGFGLPVLEALAQGCPLACSDLPAHREIGSEIPLYVNPTDVDAMAAAIARLHGDRELRAHQARTGPARAAVFSPTTSARAWRALHCELTGEAD